MGKNFLSLDDFEKDKNLLHKSYDTNIIEKSEKANHKYIRKEGDRYIYHESYQKDSGAKFHHHEMMHSHHLNQYYDAKNKLNSSLDNLMSGDGPVESPEHYIKAATHHAEKVAHHSGQKSKYFHEAVKDSKSGSNTHGEIAKEHRDENINPNTYAKAYYEHEAKKENEAKKNKSTEFNPQIGEKWVHNGTGVESEIDDVNKDSIAIITRGRGKKTIGPDFFRKNYSKVPKQ